MSKLPMIARYLLGFILFVFGLNGFIGFLPAPELAGPAADFFGTIMESHVWTLVKGFEVIIGLMLLTGRFVPLALVMLVPISLNIVTFHLALDPANIAPGALVAILNVYLLFANIDVYRPLLRATQPKK